MKFELQQVIYYIRNDKVYSAPVLARMAVENLRENWALTKEQKTIFAPFGSAGVYYGTCHGIVREEEAFSSKIEMLDAMIFPKNEVLNIDQEKLLDFLVSKMVQATDGKADPYQVRQTMQDLLDSYRL